MVVNPSTISLEIKPFLPQETQRQEGIEAPPPAYEDLFSANQSNLQTHKKPYKVLNHSSGPSKEASNIFQSKVIAQQPTSNTRVNVTSPNSSRIKNDDCEGCCMCCLCCLESARCCLECMVICECLGALGSC